jgi:hypothetical protein
MSWQERMIGSIAATTAGAFHGTHINTDQIRS